MCKTNKSKKLWGGGGWWGGGPCDFSVSPSPFGLDSGTWNFGLGLDNNHSGVSLLPDAGVGQTALRGGHLDDEHQDDDEGWDAVPDQADLEHVAVTPGTNHLTHPEERKTSVHVKMINKCDWNLCISLIKTKLTRKKLNYSGLLLRQP